MVSKDAHPHDSTLYELVVFHETSVQSATFDTLSQARKAAPTDENFMITRIRRKVVDRSS